MADYKLVPKSTVDELAQFIRKVDGNHKMGAGALAEKICERFRVDTPAVQGEPVFMWHRGATDDESEVVDVDCACPCCVPLYAAPQPAEQQPDVTQLVGALEEGLRAIGDHHAPGDCYATGPMTGDPFRDLVQCPACSFIAMCDDLLAAYRKQGGSND